MCHLWTHGVQRMKRTKFVCFLLLFSLAGTLFVTPPSVEAQPTTLAFVGAPAAVPLLEKIVTGIGFGFIQAVNMLCNKNHKDLLTCVWEQAKKAKNELEKHASPHVFELKKKFYPLCQQKLKEIGSALGHHTLPTVCELFNVEKEQVILDLVAWVKSRCTVPVSRSCIQNILRNKNDDSRIKITEQIRRLKILFPVFVDLCKRHPQFTRLVSSATPDEACDRFGKDFFPTTNTGTTPPGKNTGGTPRKTASATSNGNGANPPNHENRPTAAQMLGISKKVDELYEKQRKRLDTLNGILKRIEDHLKRRLSTEAYVTALAQKKIYTAERNHIEQDRAQLVRKMSVLTQRTPPTPQRKLVRTPKTNGVSLPPQTFIPAHDEKKTTPQLIAEILADIATFERVLTARFENRPAEEIEIIKEYIRWKLSQETTLEELHKNEGIISNFDPKTIKKEKILISKKKEVITQSAKIMEREINAYFEMYRTNPEKATEAIKGLKKMFGTHEALAEKKRLYEVPDPLRCDDSLSDTRPPKTTTTSPLIPSYPTPTFKSCDRN